MEHRAFGNRMVIRFAKPQNQRTRREHHNLNRMRHAQRLHRAGIICKSGAQRRHHAHHHHQERSRQENAQRQLGIFAHHNLVVRIRFRCCKFRRVFRVLQTALVFGVVFQLLAQLVHNHARQANPQNGRRHSNHQHIAQMNPLRLQIRHRCYHRRRNRAGDNRKLRRNHRHRQRTLGADAVAAAHFRNHRQHRIRHVPRARHHGKQISNHRRDKGNVLRITAQNARRHLNHIIQTARCLHRRRRRHHRHNHQHHINRRAGGLQTETEGQHRQAQAAEHAQADAAHLRPHQNTQQNNRKLHCEQHNELRFVNKQ